MNVNVGATVGRMPILVAQVETTCCQAGDPSLLDADEAVSLAEKFKALSDPTRVRLLAHIAASPDGTACACHLPAQLGISQPTLSHHMKTLVQAGLVRREQRGRWAHYTVLAPALDQLGGYLALAENPLAR